MSIRIGIPLVGGPAWHGGVAYVEAIIKAFRSLPADEQPELWFLAGVDQASEFSLYQYLQRLVNGIVVYGAGADRLGSNELRCVSVAEFSAISDIIDFIFPVNSDLLLGFSYASWVPDLQHIHLPGLFSAEDIEGREKAIGMIAGAAEQVVVSSYSAKDDFLGRYPDFAARIDVIHFYSSFDDEIFGVDPIHVAKRYGLPDKYVICCNQFWQHKNHDNLFRGLALTKTEIHLVCTGGRSDYRNSSWFPYLEQIIRDLGIEARVTILGFLPRNEQIQLIRRSVAVIQPSFFEGWSTVLEDARALGKPVLASDIAVHCEQDVPGARYFDPNQPAQIAQLIDELDRLRDMPPVTAAEEIARTNVRSLQNESARALLRIANASIKELASKREITSGERSLRGERYLTAKLFDQSEQLAKKESVIQQLIDSNRMEVERYELLLAQQNRAIRAYRLAYGYLPAIGYVARFLRRTREIFKPRLGNLNQYSPRPLCLHASGKRSDIPDLPSISLVTPSYGQGKFIERTILGVLNQEYKSLEYIVQDGGSTDETLSVIEKYQDRLSRWVSERDSGQSEAINRGFEGTTGEIMAWLNSDDLLLPGALHTVGDYFSRHPEVDVVYGNRLLIDENDMEIGRWIMPGHGNAVLSWADYIPQETMFWRRRIWEKVGGRIDESFRFAMDWDLLVRFRDAGAKFAHIPQFLGAFRIHEHQKTSAAINDIGHKEMDRIRARLLGKVPSRREIRNAILPYLLKHLAVDMAFRVKARLGIKS